MFIALLTVTAAAGDSVLWYYGNTEHTERLNEESQELFLGMGAAKVDVEDSWPLGGLSDYRLVMLVGSSESYDADQLADLSDYRAGGGLVVLVSEAMDGDDEDPWDADVDDVFNELLEAWGATSRFEEEALDRGCPYYAEVLDEEHPLMAGVDEPFYAYSAALSVGEEGTALLGGESDQTLMVAEGDLILMADASFFPEEPGDEDDEGCDYTAGNVNLLQNLYDASCGDDTDMDGDGVLACDDCDDEDAALGRWALGYEDADLDGYGAGEAQRICGDPGDLAPEGGDCDDDDAAINPGAEEILGDGVNNDCDVETPDFERGDEDDDDDGITSGEDDDNNDGDDDDDSVTVFDDDDDTDDDADDDTDDDTVDDIGDTGDEANGRWCSNDDGSGWDESDSEEPADAKGCSSVPAGGGGLIPGLALLLLGWTRRREVG